MASVSLFDQLKGTIQSVKKKGGGGLTVNEKLYEVEISTYA